MRRRLYILILIMSIVVYAMTTAALPISVQITSGMLIFAAGGLTEVMLNNHRKMYADLVCLHCGVGKMQPWRGGFVCDRCGTTSGVQQ